MRPSVREPKPIITWRRARSSRRRPEGPSGSASRRQSYSAGRASLSMPRRDERQGRQALPEWRRLARWVPSVLSVSLCLALTICYVARPDTCAAITIIPSWAWLVPGLLLAAFHRGAEGSGPSVRRLADLSACAGGGAVELGPRSAAARPTPARRLGHPGDGSRGSYHSILGDRKSAGRRGGGVVPAGHRAASGVPCRRDVEEIPCADCSVRRRGLFTAWMRRWWCTAEPSPRNCLPPCEDISCRPGSRWHRAETSLTRSGSAERFALTLSLHTVLRNSDHRMVICDLSLKSDSATPKDK